jgi:hypothetical protein
MCGRKDPSIWHLLPLTGGQIRLLTVHGPTDDSALMKCSMEVVSLADKPIFAALSYTWGEEPRDHQVTIDLNQVAVTQSCYDALRIFRDQWFDAQILTPAPEGLSPAIQDLRQRRIKRLWIDQLCIYSDRSRIKHLRNLRFEPLFCEGVIGQDHQASTPTWRAEMYESTTQIYSSN